MKDRMDMRLEEMTTKIVTEAGLKKPATDFTSRIMSSIELQSQSVATVYTPLISKKMWWVIGVTIAAVVGYIVSSNMQLTVVQDAVSSMSSELPKWQMPKYELDVTVPNTLVYGVLIMAILIAIEIPLLKKQYNW
ncbi:MAG: hypothetical protein KUG49_01750 [Dokdonia sp.]|jgi:hypothetical protein|nr:hypothetical protein [Dokdonia sp.]